MNADARGSLPVQHKAPLLESRRGALDVWGQLCVHPRSSAAALTVHRGSPEPLARAVALLGGQGEDPALRGGIGHLVLDAVEPLTGPSAVADAAPQLADEVRRHGALLALHVVVAGQRALQLLGRLATEEPLALDVALVDAAPGGLDQQVGDGARPFAPPLGDCRRRLVLLGARDAVAPRRGSAVDGTGHGRGAALGVAGEVVLHARE